jgi:hypothetical protein
MSAVQDNKRRAGQLCAQARDIRIQARMLAGATAATADQIAATIDRLAEQQPDRAERLQAISESARRYATRGRRRLVHDPGGESPTGAITTASDQDEILVIEERDRIAAQLRDTIVRRVFAAGLSLQSAAGLTAESEVRWRIEAAIGDLDQVIREIRTVVFRDFQHRHVHMLGQDILDLRGELATTAAVHLSGPIDSVMFAHDADRLLVILRQLLGLIGEHATPISVDITAKTGSYRLTIVAAPISPGASAAEYASWFSSVQVGAAQIGVAVAMDHAPGGTRFTCRLPLGFGRLSRTD